MKKAMMLTAILCAAICLGLYCRTSREPDPAPVATLAPMQVEVTVVPTPEIEIAVAETEEAMIEAVTPTPVSTPTPTQVPAPVPTPMPLPVPTATSQPVADQPAQIGNKFYVPGFGYMVRGEPERSKTAPLIKEKAGRFYRPAEYYIDRSGPSKP